MRTKTRRMPEAEYEALFDKLMEVKHVHSNGGPFTSFYMITGDFEPTQNMAETRWMVTNNAWDRLLFQVDQVGDAILLEGEDE